MNKNKLTEKEEWAILNGFARYYTIPATFVPYSVYRRVRLKGMIYGQKQDEVQEDD